MSSEYDSFMCCRCENKFEMEETITECFGCYKPAHDWISVKDRLPENKQIVLVINNLGEIAVCRADISWNFIFMLNDTNLQIKNVTHWMDLPEPPK